MTLGLYHWVVLYVLFHGYFVGIVYEGLCGIYLW